MFDAVDRVSCSRVCLFLFCVTLFPGCQGVMMRRPFVSDAPEEKTSAVGNDANGTLDLDALDKTDSIIHGDAYYVIFQDSLGRQEKHRLRLNGKTSAVDVVRMIAAREDLSNTDISIIRPGVGEESGSVFHIDVTKLDGADYEPGYYLRPGDQVQISEGPTWKEKLLAPLDRYVFGSDLLVRTAWSRWICTQRRCLAVQHME